MFAAMSDDDIKRMFEYYVVTEHGNSMGKIKKMRSSKSISSKMRYMNFYTGLMKCYIKKSIQLNEMIASSDIETIFMSHSKLPDYVKHRDVEEYRCHLNQYRCYNICKDDCIEDEQNMKSDLMSVLFDDYLQQQCHHIFNIKYGNIEVAYENNKKYYIFKHYFDYRRYASGEYYKRKGKEPTSTNVLSEFYWALSKHCHPTSKLEYEVKARHIHEWGVAIMHKLEQMG
jgi:tRNA(His) 5'-end guanylyltransferase